MAHFSKGGCATWQWASGVYPFEVGYSAVAVLGPAEQLAGAGGGGWRRRAQLSRRRGRSYSSTIMTHNLGGHIETGGADLGVARRSLLLTAPSL